MMKYKLLPFSFVALATLLSEVAVAQESQVLLPVMQYRFGVMEQANSKARDKVVARPKGCAFTEVDLVETIIAEPRRFNLLKRSDIDDLINMRGVLFAKVSQKMTRIDSLEKRITGELVAAAGGERQLYINGFNITAELAKVPEYREIMGEIGLVRDEFKRGIYRKLENRNCSEDVLVKYCQTKVLPTFGPGWLLFIFQEAGPWKVLCPRMDESRRKECYGTCQNYLDKCNDEFTKDFRLAIGIALDRLPSRKADLERLIKSIVENVSFDARQGAVVRPASCEKWIASRESDDVLARAKATLERKWVEIVPAVQEGFPELPADRELVFMKYMRSEATLDDVERVFEKSIELQVRALASEWRRETHPVVDASIAAVFQDSSLEAVVRHPVVRKLIGLSERDIDILADALGEGDQLVQKEWREYSLRGGVEALSGFLSEDEIRVLKSIADGAERPKFETKLKIK